MLTSKLLALTEVTSGQIFEDFINITEIGQDTVYTVTAVKYINRSQLFNLSPSKRTRETAKLIHLL